MYNPFDKHYSANTIFAPGGGGLSDRAQAERQLRALEQERFALAKQINQMRRNLKMPPVRLELVPANAPTDTPAPKGNKNPLRGASPARIANWLEQIGVPKKTAASVRRRLENAQVAHLNES